MNEVIVRITATTKLIDSKEDRLPSEKKTARAIIKDPGKYNPK